LKVLYSPTDALIYQS